MKNLGESLKNLHSLKTLKLNLGECPDDEKSFFDWPKKCKVDLGLKDLGHNLKNLISLENLTLEFLW